MGEQKIGRYHLALDEWLRAERAAARGDVCTASACYRAAGHLHLAVVADLPPAGRDRTRLLLTGSACELLHCAMEVAA